MGYLSQGYLDVAKKGYVGLLNNFISMNADSMINIDNICQSASLVKTTTDTTAGSYAYYIGTPIASNEGKGTGTFIMASVELERIGFVVPPINFHSIFSKDSVSLTWTDKTYNAVSFIVERRSSSETSFTQIEELAKGAVKYIDRSLQSNTTYYYRARAKATAGYSDYSAIDSITTSSLTSVDAANHSINSFELFQNYPNPFNPTTQMKFSVKERGMTTLKVYDVLGQEVTVLYHGYAEPGTMTTVQFDASRFTSGTYFSILKSGSQRAGKKMLLVK
jgi:hypothetical protein